MSNQLGFATARKTSRGNLLAGWLAGGSVKIYTTARPANADTAISAQTLLVTVTLPDPAGDVSNGIFTGDPIASALIAATGTAAWGRVADSSGTTIFDADVGLTDSGEMIELDDLSLVQGGYCSITSFSITEG